MAGLAGLDDLAVRLLLCQPTLGLQLLEVVGLAAMFAVLVPVATRCCSWLLKRRPWYERAAASMREQLERATGGSMTEAALDETLGQLIPFVVQHGTGALLCLPAIFGLGLSREVALAMVRHGVLLQLGWELHDNLGLLRERLFTFSAFMHHGMQWAIVILMNLYYSELPGYHELVLLLEVASAASGLVGLCAPTLDATKREELHQMVILHTFGLVVMVYARFMHYWLSLSKCLLHFYTEGSVAVLLVGVVCGGVLIPFGTLKFVPRQLLKVVKFTHLYLAQADEDDLIDKPPTGLPTLPTRIAELPTGLPVLLTSRRGPEAACRLAKKHVE